MFDEDEDENPQANKIMQQHHSSETNFDESNPL